MSGIVIASITVAIVAAGGVGFGVGYIVGQVKIMGDDMSTVLSDMEDFLALHMTITPNEYDKYDEPEKPESMELPEEEPKPKKANKGGRQ
tara:strand:- start:617 stop:886 length:270 start_codon:yes stop_codon:yes gene_type:complete